MEEKHNKKKLYLGLEYGKGEKEEDLIKIDIDEYYLELHHPKDSDEFIFYKVDPEHLTLTDIFTPTVLEVVLIQILKHLKLGEGTYYLSSGFRPYISISYDGFLTKTLVWDKKIIRRKPIDGI